MRGVITRTKAGTITCSVHTDAEAVRLTHGAWSGEPAYECTRCGAFTWVKEIAQ